MSNKTGYLALRLEGPMQSWGYDSQFNRRNTGLMPTKSAVAGMCCAALGYSRGSDDEKAFLEKFLSLKMLAISIPRIEGKRVFEVRRLIDYHTVEGTIKASGASNPNAVITYRQYLNDAAFGVILSGDKHLLDNAAQALKDPAWGIWLGRKSCIPTAPVCAGLFETEADAVKSLVGEKSISSFTRQMDVDDFKQGIDSLLDNAISFDSRKRQFVPHRINKIEAEKG
ncbi:MAG: type I-E CRISPR-associated protein Cas5/CasD [Spirochaetes bacterium]|jgi:CRISPR system Cascade subunit CasD|nr:type I-E CRISPR-associated protein Cas5/CasD [Spirochaetota bacterium]